jgi:tetratricopeptide (TPR) repeat protein
MPNSQPLTELAGTQQMRLERPEQAIEIARQGVRRRPADVAARVWLARLLAIGGRKQEAEQQFKEAIAVSPADIQGWSGLFYYHLRIGEAEKARQVLLQLTDAVPMNSPERSFVLGQGYEMLGELELAASHYQQAAGDPARTVETELRLARVYLRLDPGKAEACLRRAVKIDPQALAPRRTLALLLALRGGDEQRQEADRLLSLPAEDGLVSADDRRLQALLIAQRGGNRNLAGAIEILEPLVAKGSTRHSGDRLLLAQLYEQLAQLTVEAKRSEVLLESARSALLAVAARRDATAGEMGALAGFLLRRGRNLEADSWLEKMDAALSRTSQADADSLAQFVGLCLQRGDLKRCAFWLDKLQAADSRPLRSLALHVRVLFKHDPQCNVESYVEPRGEELLAQARDSQARTDLLNGIGDIYLGIGRLPSAERWYRRLAEEDPSKYSKLATAIARQGRLSDAIEICRLASQREQTSQAALVVAEILVQSGAVKEDMDLAGPIVQAALKRFPNDPGLMYSVAVLRIAQSKFPEAVELLRKTIELNPRDVAALNNLALLLTEKAGGREEALELVDRAIEIAGCEMGLLDTKGAILLSAGHAEQAVTWLEAAARDESADPRHRFHLALAYRDLGDLDRARTEMRRAVERDLDRQPLTPVDRRMLEKLRAEVGL